MFYRSLTNWSPFIFINFLSQNFLQLSFKLGRLQLRACPVKARNFSASPLRRILEYNMKKAKIVGTLTYLVTHITIYFRNF